MSENTPIEPAGDEAHQPGVEDDVLIGRIVDGEATPRDRSRFEHLAASNESLWRTLALRQIDMATLTERLAQHTDSAEYVDVLPGGRDRGRLNWTLIASGWAAVIVVAVVWATNAGNGGHGDLAPGRPLPAGGAQSTVAPLTPDEHLKKYLAASFVLGELDPILLETQQLGDGRHRIRFVRRIEEYADVDLLPRDLADDTGRLTIDPADLRGKPPSDDQR